MRKNFIYKKYVQSSGGKRLKLISYKEEGAHIIEGVLQEQNGFWYPIIRGVPCFLRGLIRPDFESFRKKHDLPRLQDKRKRDKANIQQLLTNKTFSDKWRRFRNYGLEPKHKKFLLDWYCKKFDLTTLDDLKEFYKNKKLILEAGPGSGFNSIFMAENSNAQVFAADISDAAFTAFENSKKIPNCHVIQADLMDLPFGDQVFDFIIADGVLHHTPNTKKAFHALYEKLKPGGQFFFYVYKKMGASREFCDQYIRNSFSKLNPVACYEACEGLTELGRELNRLNAKIELKKPIPILGIPAGIHNVQRLIYYNFVKCFWNDAFDFETNNMVNFDWYHPHNAWQHTQEEVEGWLKESGVKKYSFNDSNPNGISVLLRKPSK
jgi:SAM-dependent methyltransferase